MNFTELQNAIAQITAITDPSGVAMLNSIMPRIVEAAEYRMLREPDFDFLSSRGSDIEKTTTAGVRSVPIPTTMYIVEGVNLIIPANTASPSDAGAQRINLLRASRQMLDIVWPVESVTKTPNPLEDFYFAIFNQDVIAPSDPAEPTPLPSSILIGPTPDAQYQVEFTGVVNQDLLSAANPTNFLSTYFPDIYLASALIFVYGAALKNFGAQSDDPRTAMSWLAVYNQLKEGAGVDSLRQKAQIDGSSPMSPNQTKPNIAMLQTQQAAAAAASRNG